MAVANARIARRHLTACAALATAAPAFADDACFERPGLTTAPCIVERGRAQVETGAVDWTVERRDGVRTDTVLAADTLVRIGVLPRLEAQLGWTPFGHVRERDSGGVRERSGAGDARLGLKLNLRRPDGGGLSLAVAPFATLPTGRSGIGAGTWGAGLSGTVSVEASDRVQIALTPEISARPDEDGDGRHLAFGAGAGIGFDLTDSLNASANARIIRDRDPSERSTEALAQVAFAWTPDAETQLDAGVAVGLNRASPDLLVQAGVSRRF